MKKSIAIVVVTYNRLHLLKEVVKSLREQSMKNYSIIVVNNGSTDDTLLWLSQQSDIITITQENSGGAGGFYTGMKYAVEMGFDYCWVMDDDVICLPDALENLYTAYHRKEGIGFVCSKVNGIDGCPMNTPHVDTRTEANGYSDYWDLLEYGMLKVNMATFVSVFLSTDVITKVGLPYREYFIWGDDSEYTSRVSKQFDSYVVGSSVVVHKRSVQKSLTFEEESDPQRLKLFFYYFRNNWYSEYREEDAIVKYKFAMLKLKEALALMMNGNFVKGEILFKAAAAFVLFNPTIEFPKNAHIGENI